MIGFGIDRIQAEFVAEIRLRNLNREYILKRTQETESLEAEIADLQAVLDSPARVRGIIVEELRRVAEAYGVDRRTALVTAAGDEDGGEEEELPDYPVHLFLSREGYFKKITPQSLRMSGEQKFKEGDGLAFSCEATNRSELLVFTDRCQVYKARCSEFDDTKASVLGDYLPGKLGMDEGESVAAVCLPGDYAGSILFAFANGKVARVAAAAYDTKTNRRRLTGAYSDKSPLIGVEPVASEDQQLVLRTAGGRALIFSVSQLAVKATRTTQGVSVITLKKKDAVTAMAPLDAAPLANPARYRARTIPGSGALLRPEDAGETQMTLDL